MATEFQQKQRTNGVGVATPVVQVSSIQIEAAYNQRPPSYVTSSNISLVPSTVVREQYCCLSKLTRREKVLLCTVTVLSLVVLTLVMLILTDTHCKAVAVVGDHILGGGVPN